MNSRLYVVAIIVGASEHKYLVDAGQKGSAERHVAKKHIVARPASGKDVAELMDKGIKPESALTQPETGEQPTLIPDLGA